MLAIGADLAFVLAFAGGLILLGQEFHRKVHALEVTAGHGQVTRLLGTAGQQHGVKLFHQLLGADGFLGPVGDLAVLAQTVLTRHQHAGADLQTFGDQLLDTAVDMGLVQLEVRNAVAQQAADLVVLLEQRHVVTGTHQLLGGCQTRRASPHHGHLLARQMGRQLRLDPALFPGAVDDGVLDGLDADGRAVDVGHAGSLAGCGADAARELREVVGAVQHLNGTGPIPAVHQIVEVRDDVVDRAAVVAERRAAVHAACALDLGLLGREGNDELLVVLHALCHGQVAFFNAVVFQKTGGLSHDVYSLKSLLAGAARWRTYGLHHRMWL